MESLVSAIVGDLFSRSASFVIRKYWQQKGTEENLEMLQQLLLRIQTIVEETEGRHITNQGMLQQLQMLREGMYKGYYMLDTFKYQILQEKAKDEVNDHSFAFSRVNPAKRFRFSLGNMQWMVFGIKSVKELQEMLNSLANIIANIEEFVIFLRSYPRIYKKPYDTYLLLNRFMFGRQMELNQIITFLLQTEPPGNEKLGVLPIIGPTIVGKSTLVEHVCLDERVRNYFSSIVFFTADNLENCDLVALRDSSVIKHQNLTSHGRSLVVIELVGNIDEGTWRRLFSSQGSHIAGASKIIITSRSERIASFGTVQALKLKSLPQEAFWYFFKAVAFGSTNPAEQPKLASICMEIAVELEGCFAAANVIGCLLRTNLNVQFWCQILKRTRESTKKHLLLFGERPASLLQKNRPIYIVRMAKTSNLLVSTRYQTFSTQRVPKIAVQDIIFGSVTPPEKFEALAWRSHIPPYHNYLVSCVRQTPKYNMVNKKRSRQQRV